MLIIHKYLDVKIRVRMANTALHANQNADVRMEVLAIRRLDSVFARPVGLVQFVQTDVRLAHGAKTVLKRVNVSMAPPVIISQENVNVSQDLSVKRCDYKIKKYSV